MLFPMNRFLVAIFLIVDTTFLGADEVDFDLHIRPILAEYCLECHGPDAGNRQGDLRLDIAEAFRSPCVEPGNAAESQLFLRIQSTDDDFRMPPAGHKKELKPAQIETIRRWIDQGAHFEGHWAYQPVKRFCRHERHWNYQNHYRYRLFPARQIAFTWPFFFAGNQSCSVDPSSYVGLDRHSTELGGSRFLCAR